MPLLICAIVTLASALVSAGFAVAALRGAEPDGRETAMYALARSVALVVVAMIGLVSGSVPFEAAAAIAMTVVQALDAVIGVRIRDRQKTVGPAVLAVLNAAALVWVLAS